MKNQSSQNKNELLRFSVRLLTILLLGIGLSFQSPSVSSQTNNSSTPNVVFTSKNDLSKNESFFKGMGFEINGGQFNTKVLYVTRNARQTVFLTSEGLTFSIPFFNTKPNQKINPRAPDTLNDHLAQAEKQNLYAFKMNFKGSRQTNPEIKAMEELPAKINYFPGQSDEKWYSNLTTYNRIKYQELYTGVDLDIYGNSLNELEYDFTVAPGTDLSRIEIEFEGVTSLETDQEGNLLIHTPAGTVLHRKPFSYQKTGEERKNIESHYEIRGANSVGFTSDYYDLSQPLIIDPSIGFSTFLGGSGADYGEAIAKDANGNIYVAGYTGSMAFPTTIGTYDQTFNGGLDVFLSKFSADGNTLLFSTFIGGSSNDFAYGLAIDASGNAYIIGSTQSTNFPTVNAFDSVFNGGLEDAFVVKVLSGGAGLGYSTYLGGNGREIASKAFISSAGSLNIVGSSSSTNFPTSFFAYDSTANGGFDAIWSQFASDGTLNYSTYIGGSSDDYGQAIFQDSTGLYIAGATYSANYPVTSGAYDISLGGASDAFVTKFAGGGLGFSTFLGGSSGDEINALAVDSSRNIFLAGGTTSSDFPTTPGSIDRTQNGSKDVFVTQFIASGTALMYSTYLGGSNDDQVTGMVMDEAGRTYLIGYTTSANFPVTSDAIDNSYNGSNDVFLTKLAFSSASPLYSSFMGGSGSDIGRDLIYATPDKIYFTGNTSSSNFPSIFSENSNALDPTYNGGTDAFVAQATLSVPTAAEVEIGGRVANVNGVAIKGARITMIDSSGQTRTAVTNSFGIYHLENVVAGSTVVISVVAKGYIFTDNSQVLTILEANREINFMASE